MPHKLIYPRIKILCLDCGKEFEISTRTKSRNPKTYHWRCKDCTNKHMAELLHQRLENMTNEQKASISEKKRQAMLKISEQQSRKLHEYNSNLTKEQRKARSEKHKEYYTNLTNEEKEAYADRFREIWHNFPPEKKAEWSERSKLQWANMSKEERQQVSQRVSNWYHSLSDIKKSYMYKIQCEHSLKNNKNNKLFKKYFHDKLYNLPLYYLAEFKTSNQTTHSWDYGIFDYANNLVCLVDIDGVFFHADDKFEYDGIHGKYEYDLKRGKSIPINIKHCIIRELHFDEDWEYLMYILSLSYEEFIKEEVKYLSAMPFPYPSYTDDELIFSWNKLLRANPNNKYYSTRLQCHLGDHIVYHFCHSLYDERIWKPEWIEHALRSHMIYHPHMNKNKLLMCVPHEEFTPPGQAQILLKDHIGEYIDEHCDVGMMLGCIASNTTYRTICTNMARYNEIQNILHWMDDHGIQYDVKIGEGT